MLISPDSMRLLLLLCMLAMVLLAAFDLRRQNLPPLVYVFWGLVAILVPIAGPFAVIWIKPGNRRVQTYP
jgi:hypothetical protein